MNFQVCKSRRIEVGLAVVSRQQDGWGTTGQATGLHTTGGKRGWAAKMGGLSKRERERDRYFKLWI